MVPGLPLSGPPLAWPEDRDDLPRGFVDRAALADHLRRRFPAAGGPLSPIRGGRRAAAARLAAIDPAAYGRSRNALDGAVTGLSPYIRHGVLTLPEVRDALREELRRRGQGRRQGEKLMQELGWRDYWQRLWQELGDGIWQDREPGPGVAGPAAPGERLPADVREGRTGLACMDAFQAELVTRGWLHNHARMWLAAYLVHWRRQHWSLGARWFLEHLLDGDPASNNLSWQWVAGTFSSRPYLFNRHNLERYGGGRHCRRCAAADRCPFDADYDTLRARLLPPAAPVAPAAAPGAPGGLAAGPQVGSPPSGQLRRPILWIHGEALGPANPALRAWPGRPAVFVFDRERIGAWSLSRKRLAFLMESALELPVTLREGEVAHEVLRFAARHDADGVVTSRGVDPRFRQIAATIAARLPLEVRDPEPFVALPLRGPKAPSLRRFHRYWKQAEPLLWQGWDARTQESSPGVPESRSSS